MSLGDKFREFTKLNYKDQAISFLNAYWNEIEKDAEKLWQWVIQFTELDQEKKADGADLDEFNAHRFLEKNQETKTVKELREQLKAIDLDFNKRMALLEYLCFNYKKSVADFVGRPQGDNSKEIEKAQNLLAEVQSLLEIALKKADDAKASADVARARAAEAAAAAEEQRAALAEVQAQEDARNAKTKELSAKSEDQNAGLVSRNKAKNELAQHLAEDPLPLRKAKITLEAANRKAEKAKAAADAAKAAAEADEAAANAAVADTEKKVAEAEAFLAEVKAKSGGNGQGSLWWLSRELEEKKKYMPKAKGGKW